MVNIYIITILFCSCIIVESTYFFPYVYPRRKLQAKPDGDAGEPLILTPYLIKGTIELAQNLSRVPLTEKMKIASYAGFFTVNPKYGSNQFFWYFPASLSSPDAPVVIWLQGGPGGSSLYGLFTEIGPIIAKKDGFSLRKYHWALSNHLIFIDNPVGTGFSFTQKEEGYCTDELCVGRDLYSTLQQFLVLFPELSSNPVFITGESYAGKYIPSLAMEIHRQNEKGQQKINLKGLAIGNGYCDPINQLDYANYLYQHGLIDDNQLQVFLHMQESIATEIKNNNWATADIIMDHLMDGELANFSYFKNFTGFNYYYNILQANDEEDVSALYDLLKNKNVRRSIHVGNSPFNSGEEVQLHLALDILKSVAPDISFLLSNYPILFYNGQLDIVVAYPLTESFLKKLKFSSAEEYRNAKRYLWKVDNDIAGYVKKAGNLTEVVVRNAGHMVPHDQPKWAWDLITKFIRGKL